MRTFTRLVAVALAEKIEETDRHLQRTQTGADNKKREIKITWPISSSYTDSETLKPELFPISADDVLILYLAKAHSLLNALWDAHTSLCDDNAHDLNKSFALGLADPDMGMLAPE